MSRLTGPVLVVGAGLLGTSVALACRRAGLDVVLTDRNPEHVRTASGLGAGRPLADGDQPQLVVVAVSPDSLGAVIADSLLTGAVVTDVGSVKSEPLREVADRVDPGTLTRYVGSHPMAGSERSGPLAGSATLFEGRPWAITPHEASDPEAVALVEELVTLCGGVPVHLAPTEHDRAVARTSHLPHLLSVLVAGQMAGAPTEHLALSGQGVRDVTRIAASDPGLWQQILTANSEAVLDLLGEVRDQLDALMVAVRRGERSDLRALLDLGVAGTRAIPGKHGGPAVEMASVFVSVPDHPGELARLFADCGESDVNIEDVHIDHDPGRPVGLVELGRRRRDRGPRDRVLGIEGLDHAAVGSRPVDERTETPADGHESVVVAIDGTSGSGKSSTSRGVAMRLGLRYLDTGAMFRAMTWWMLDHGVDVEDPAAIAEHADDPVIESGTDAAAPTSTVDGRDVSVEISGPEVTSAVSPVSAVPEVRARLLDLQREIIGDGGIVVEGRDIGSVVWPQAEVKVYLTADPAARAARRAAEEGGSDLAATRASLEARDRIDSGRATAPLVMADGAVHVDGTDLTLDEVIDAIAGLADSVGPS